MCGIVGSVGVNQNQVPVVINGLKHLEYRGYDSWGIAGLVNGTFEVKKFIGAVTQSNGVDEAFSSQAAIAHTRWATHGKVSKKNAHPHLSPSKKYAVVHNGVIENWQVLKEKMDCVTQSDSVVLSWVIDQNGISKAGIEKTISIIKGRNAWCVLENSGRLAGATTGAPLIVGMHKNDQGIEVSSDTAGFSKKVEKIWHLPPKTGFIFDKSFKAFGNSGNLLSPKWKKFSYSSKGVIGVNAMRDEMAEQPAVLQAIFNRHTKLKKIYSLLSHADQIFVIGAGSAYFASGYIAEKLRGIDLRAQAVSANEFGSWYHFITKKTAILAVSQSGETADTNAVIEYCLKNYGVAVASIINVTESTLARLSDEVFSVEAGPERAVASTKAFTAQCAVGECLANFNKNQKSPQFKNELEDWFVDPLHQKTYEKLANVFSKSKSVFCIGTGLGYWSAQEWALKLKEIGYVHAEALSAGELKHGVLALITKDTPVVGIVPNSGLERQKCLNALEEIKSRGGRIIGVSTIKDSVFSEWIELPETPLELIIACIPAQRIAYEIAVLNKRNPDRPRNLAKCVTVH